MESAVRLGALIGTPALEPELERALARAAAAGDQEARDRLVSESLRLVALRVFALGVRPAERDDAFQSGVVGLMAAVDRFDPDRGVRLATFAWPWITAAVRAATNSAGGGSNSSEAVDDAADEPLDPDVRGDLGFLLDGLPTLVAEVMRLRFGFGDGSGDLRSRASVAARLGLTISEVRSVETHTLANLRHRLARLGHRAPGTVVPRVDPL